MEERIILQDYAIKDFKNFLNACKVVIKEEPEIILQSDGVKINCGSEAFRYYGELKPARFTVFEWEKPFTCKLDFKDISALITKKVDRIIIRKVNDKIGLDYLDSRDNLIYGSELSCG